MLFWYHVVNKSFVNNEDSSQTSGGDVNLVSNRFRGKGKILHFACGSDCKLNK